MPLRVLLLLPLPLWPYAALPRPRALLPLRPHALLQRRLHCQQHPPG
jgi:hypothetical protein